MSKSKMIEVEGREIAIISDRLDDFISLTDIAKHKNEEATGLVISHWLSTRYTVEFMGLWEQIHNPTFNVTEFGNIKSEAGSNGYVLSSKQWIPKQMQLALYQNRADMAAVLLPIGGYCI
ncbi:KilA-N domain-containing protein [Niabella yanshanensis]|uniref:KilA-N domain-containing protein n=1 Tax=Niabella yanshanensis TaxID=577386 RepID=A0ABZ0W7K5_9BACT|nr:KilA-N domain-containing protein [Niabella yanshanensis]WQD38472.1 KilA-N domain-containing protein [Niabella yanshanensis]